MEALYRKYRPSTFADVVGQEHIERTLKNAIEQDKVSHAYLFCGPRGTGKTTTARILAKALMCEKGPTIEPDGTCPECQAIAQGTHPDVYELDAASRTGVENVREEIISRVSYAPTRGAWKVYIIDEVHMLSTAAFNALLKTIEEPPSHVVFILCTTDPQKVPDTILSRCQRFDFHRISIESIVARLGAVCAKEGVEFEAEALELIAHRAEGGMRNALTSLEQLIAYCGGKATLEGAQSLLGSLDNADLSEIVEAIGRRDAVACFNWVARYVETGADLAQFVQDLSEHVRTLYLLSMAGLDVELEISESTRTVMIEELKLFGQDRLSRMLIVLGDVAKELRISSNPRLSFEIALTRMIRPESDLTLEALAERMEELERRLDGMSSIAAQPAVKAESPAVAPTSQQISAPAQAAPQLASAPVQPAAPSQSQVPESAKQPSSRQARAASGQMPAGAPASPSQVEPASGARSATASPAAPVSAAGPVGFQPAPQPVAQPEPLQAASAPAQQSQPAMLTAQIDLTNPAAVQRLWHSVTASLRKVNPARGVLFMNAKVSAEVNGQGIVVEFGKDSAFAFNAAQKTEVQELLAKTIRTVAGGTVPYRLALAGGAQTSAAAQPVSGQQSASSSPQIKNPYAAKAVAAVRAAQAASHGASQGAVASRQNVAPSSAREQVQQPQVPAAQPAGAPAAAGSGYAQPTPAYAAPAQMPSSGQPVQPPEPYDDQVPLDVYGASVPAEYDEDPYAQPASQRGGAVGLAQSAQPVSSSRSVAPSVPSVSGFSAPRAAGQPSPAPSSTAALQPKPAPAASDQNEAEQIKSILTRSFGEGIKFEELSD